MARFVIDNFSGGINMAATKRNIRDNEMYVVANPSSTQGTLNTAPSKSGGLERRYGLRDRQSGLLAVVGNVPITGMGIYRPINSLGSKRVLVAANQRVYSLTYSGSVLTYANDLTGGGTVPNINPTNAPVNFKQFKDWIYAFVGPDPVTGFGLGWRWDGQVTDATFGGAWGWTSSGLSRPLAAGTATSAAAGGRMSFAGTGAAGEYRYGFTFVHGELGESNILSGVNASALGAATAAGQVTIAAMPWTAAGWRNQSDRRSITSYRIYRTLQAPNLNDDSLNTYYLVADSADFVGGFGTTPYVDQKNDAELVKAYQGDSNPFKLTTDGFTGTLAPQYVEVHKDRMFFGGGQLFDGAVFREYGSVLQWSRLSQPSTFEGYTQVASNDGYKITFLKSFRGELVVGKENSIHALYGDSPQNFSQRQVIADIGCVAPNSMVEGDGALFWLSQQGVVKYYGGGRYEIVSRNLSPLFERSSAAGKQTASAGFKDGKYYLSLNRSESTIWVYDNSYAAPGSWYRWTSTVTADKPNPYCWLKLDDVLEGGELYFGTDSTGGGGGGRIVQVGGRFSDAGFPQDSDLSLFGGTSSPIELSVQTKQYDMGTPETIKQFKSVCIDAEELGNGLIITWIVDNGAATGSLSLVSGRSGTGTETDPYTTSPNTRPITYTLPQKAFGRFISFQIDADPSAVSSPHKIDRIIIEYEETGTTWMRGD